MMRTIYFKVAFFFFLMIINQSLAADADGFFFNDFKAAFVTRDGAARITDNGLLQLTDLGDKYETGHAFYSGPLKLKKGGVSFSTTFVFAIASELGANKLSGQGMAFVIAPQRALPGALPNQYLGLFNETSNGQSSNNVLAVEIDTVYNIEFDTIQGPHVGIDINSLKSVNSTDPAYYVNGESKQINVNSGEPVQVWIEYDGIDKKLTVTLAPLNTLKPDTPLLTLSRDLSTIFLDDMYVGFSASTQTVLTYHYILGWSFKIDGAADALNLSSLPKLPPQSSSSHDTKPNLAADSDQGFTYNDFKSAYITRDGAARVAENGLLRLTDVSDKYETGHVFYSGPLKLKGNVSFSTTFVIAIASELGTNQLSGQGMAFVIAPQRAMPGALANQYLGLFNETSNGQSTNNVLAVEIDTVYNIEFDTIQGPHVGIDVNSLKSVSSTAPAYYVNGESKQINVNSGDPVQVWVDYDGIDKKLTVTLAPLNTMKPDTPLLSLSKDLSTIFADEMYVGFSASTQTVPTYHYVLGWSFQINGVANALNLPSLPTIPPQSSSSIHAKPNLAVIIPATLGYILALVLLMF